ncbi:hypothetical protein ES703_16994 [subsurface metagenome]
MATDCDLALKASADSFFLLPDVETIIYLPLSGSSRSISAIISRPGPAEIGPLDGGSRPHIEFKVKNDATEGISSDKINTGGDKVIAALRKGATAVKLRITEILHQDAAMMRLRAY